MPEAIDHRLESAAHRLTGALAPDPPPVSGLVSRRHNRRLVFGAVVVIACVGLALAAALHSHHTESLRTIDQPGVTGSWKTQVLDNPTLPPFTPLPQAIGLTDTQSVMLTVEGSGLLHSWAAGRDLRFGTVHDSQTGVAGFGSAGLEVVRLGDEWLAIGSGAEELRATDMTYAQRLIVLRSRDGIRWTKLDTSGLGHGGNVSSATTLDGMVVVVGTWEHGLSTTDGSHHAVAWSSRDGVHWTEAVLPTPPASSGDAWADEVTRVDGELVAFGSVSNRNAVWTSRDLGRTWDQVIDSNIASLPDWSAVATNGDVIIATAPAGNAYVSGRGWGEGTFVSRDRGRTWKRVRTDSTNGTLPDPAKVVGASGRLVVLASPPHGVSTCDRKRLSCPRTEARLARSTDGVHWSPLSSAPWPADQVAVAPDGRIVVVRFAQKIQVATWTGSPMGG
jgi:hypothetical protein